MSEKLKKFLELKKKETKPNQRPTLTSVKRLVYNPEIITHDDNNNDDNMDNITKTNIDLSKIPKDILINAHNQLMNKGVPENMRYYTTNMSKATKDKVLEHIKKQKYSMKEFENIARELHNSKKDENKKGLLIRKQTAKEIEEMNKPKLNIDAFIKDKQKEIDEGLNKRKSKPTHKTGNIMKARSDLKKKGDKYTVDTEMNIKKGLDGKIKKALKKSIETELNKKMSGGSIRKIVLDYSSDEDIRGKGNCCSNNTIAPQNPRIVNTPFTRKKSISEDGEPPLKGVEKTIHRRRGRRFDVEVIDPYMDDDMLDVYTKGRAQNIGVLKAKSNTKKIGKIEKIDLEIKELLKQKNVLGENEFKKRMKILEDKKKLLE